MKKMDGAKKITKSLGIVGLILLIFGVLALGITKMMNWFTYAHFGLGILFVASYIVFHFDSFTDRMQQRSTTEGAKVAIYALLVLCLIILVNMIAFRKTIRWDLTESGVYSLEDQTTKLLDGLKGPLTITAFFDAKNPKKQITKNLMERYADHSKQVKLDYIDPNRQPDVAERLGVKDGVVRFQSASGRKTDITIPSEQAFTNAIIQISSGDSPLVYFSSGRGERSLDDETEAGFSVVKDAMVNEGYEPKTLEKSLASGIPEDADLLVVAGPTATLTAEEAAAIDGFLENSGKVILLLDPVFSDPRLSKGPSTVKPTGLETLTKSWGIELGSNVILEKHIQLLSGESINPFVLTSSYADHEIVNPLKGLRTYFHLNRSVRKATKSPKGLELTELVTSRPGSSESWAESNVAQLLAEGKAGYDKADFPGPVPLAVVGSKEAKEGEQGTQLVVFGDSDFISNKYIRTQDYNFDLFLNTLNWMWGKKEQISIRPKLIRSSSLLLTPQQTYIIFYVAVLAIPEFILILGLFIYWRRRGL